MTNLQSKLVYFDCECQCALFTGGANKELNDKDLAEIEGMMGGGNYNWYVIPVGYRIVEVQSRSEARPLRLVIEEIPFTKED